MRVFWTTEEDGEQGEFGGDGSGRASCSTSRSEEEGGFFWDRPLFKKYGLFLAIENKWALRWIGFCIGLLGCLCFVLEGLNTRGSPLETLSSSPAYCRFERKKDMLPA